MLEASFSALLAIFTSSHPEQLCCIMQGTKGAHTKEGNKVA